MQRWTVAIVSLVVVVAGASAVRAEGWLPIWNPFAASTAPAGPTVWQRMSNGTQSTLSGAGRMLNPWSSTSAAPAAQPLTGTRRVSNPTAAKESGGASWWWPWGDDQDLPHYDSPSDWLSQPRP